MDPDPGQLCRMGHPRGADVHEVFHAPVLLSIPAVQLDGEPCPRGVHQGCRAQLPVTAAQEDGGVGLSLEVECGAEDDMQRWCKRLVEQRPRGQSGLDVPLHGRLLEVWHREVVVSHLVALRAMRPPAGLGAAVGAVERRRAAPLGKQVQVARPGDRQGVAVANMTVQSQVRQGARPGDPVEEGVAPGTKRPSLGGEGHVCWAVVRTPLRRPRAAFGDGWCPLLGCCRRLAGSLLGWAAHPRLDVHRERAPFREADQGQPAAGQPRHWLAIQTGKESIQSVGVLARFGHHDCIASQAGDLRCAIPGVTTAHPKQRGPRDHRGENTLHGTLTAPWTGPTGPASHRDAPRHDQHGSSHPAAWAEGRRRHRGMEPLHQCDHGHGGLPCRWLSVEGVVDDNSTTVLRPKPFHVSCPCPVGHHET